MKTLPKDRRDLAVEALSGLEREMELQPFLWYSSAMCNLCAVTGTINVMMSQNVRKNARVAADMAVQAAITRPEMDVWYINTFAGARLLQECFADALGLDATSGVPFGEQPHVKVPNLHILQVPLGEWNVEQVCASIEMMGREQAAPVVIFNSFEFGALTRSGVERLSRDVMKLREQFGATVIVFSHELRRDFEPGVASRGAIGKLAAFSHHYERMFDRSEFGEQVDRSYLPNVGHAVMPNVEHAIIPSMQSEVTRTMATTPFTEASENENEMLRDYINYVEEDGIYPMHEVETPEREAETGVRVSHDYLSLELTPEEEREIEERIAAVQAQHLIEEKPLDHTFDEWMPSAGAMKREKRASEARRGIDESGQRRVERGTRVAG